MDGASTQFILFGLAVALISNASRHPVWRVATLALASGAFVLLLSDAVIALVPFASFLFLGYGAIQLQRRGRRCVLATSVVVIVAIYAWLKQYTILPAVLLMHQPYLVVGLSYVFFRVLHLVIDASAPGRARDVRPLSYVAYTTSFLTFVSGPIQRYEDFTAEIAHPPELSGSIVAMQVERIVRGFFKVNVLGMLLSMVHDDSLARLATRLPLSSKLAAALSLVGFYPLFVYCNFSGYIDIVIGLARLLPMRLPENFDRPFSARSFLDFWTRWHITLSVWFKTYVYNPMLTGLMRRDLPAALEPYAGVPCFLLTFLLVGIWHGRTSEFLMFGLLQGVGVAANKLWQIALGRRLGKRRYRALTSNPIYAAGARGLTYSWFAFTALWFWASWSDLGAVLRELGGPGFTIVAVALWLTATLVLAAWETARARLLAVTVAGQPLFTNRYALTVYATIFAVFSFILVAVLAQPAPGVVYKTF